MGSIATAAAAGFATAAARCAFTVGMGVLLLLADVFLTHLHFVVVQILALIRFHRLATRGGQRKNGEQFWQIF